MGDMEAAYHVRLEAREFDVAVDQRDWAAMEAQAFPTSAGVLATRFMAWNAARRTGLYNGAWHRFNETDCLSVDPLDDVDDVDQDADIVPAGAEGEQSTDPTPDSTTGPKDPSAASTSRSRAPRAKASKR